MTWRGAVMMSLALPVVAAGAAVNALYVAGVLLLALAGVLVAVDSRRALRATTVRATRAHDDILSVGVPNAIRVHVASLRPADALIRDECPPEARPSRTRWRARLPADLGYTVTPRVRGQLRLGRVIVRANGPWRLGWRQVAAGEPRTVPVEADIAAVRVYDALARRGQLTELGVRTLRLRTEGTEFERVREAVPDDPMRSINWKATARSGRLMATELMPERAQPVILCVDHGRLMGVLSGELTKLDHALNAALLLAHVALRSGDRVGMLTFTDAVTSTLAPRSGGLQLRRVLDSMRGLHAEEMEPDYDAALQQLSRWQRRRALTIVFTDVADMEQSRALVRQCARLRRRHVPLVVTVRDPTVESAAQRSPGSAAEAYERAVAGGLLADRDDALEVLRRSGVNSIDADARTLSPRLVNRYLELKRQAVL